MTTIGVRELANSASAIVADVEHTGTPAFITRHGRPVAVMLSISEDDLYDYVLAHAPEFVTDMREADAAYARGDRGETLDDVLAEIESEPTA